MVLPTVTLERGGMGGRWEEMAGRKGIKERKEKRKGNKDMNEEAKEGRIA